jgi:hypothetical protein
MNYPKNLHKGEAFLIQDIAIIAISVLIAIVLVKTNVLSDILLSSEKMQSVGSFIAGMFFTSIFTTAPAIVTLGNIASNGSSVISNAVFGAFGAVIGDVVISQFIIGHNSIWRRTHALFKLRYFRWLTFLFGGLLIASPLPDELGIGLLGFSKMKLSQFIPVSFFFNFIGIVLIGLIAKTI